MTDLTVAVGFFAFLGACVLVVLALALAIAAAVTAYRQRKLDRDLTLCADWRETAKVVHNDPSTRERDDGGRAA